MPRKYRAYTNEDIVNKAKDVKSIAGLARALDLREVGGNYKTIKRNLQKLNINTEHWTGQAWNKDQQLKDWIDYKRPANLKKHLIREKGNCCARCFINKWLREILTLELHHVDGNSTNNTVENLQLLCPNCHSLTHNWRNRKRH